MGGIQLHGEHAVLTLPHPAAVAALSEDEALSALRAYEVAAAGLAELSAAVAGELARRRRAAAVREVGPDASRPVREREASEAEAAVVDEIRLASGLGVVDARARVELGRGSTLRTGTIRSALSSGACSWLMARTWQDATSGLDPHEADQIARYCTRATRDGTVLSMATFRGRLNRQLAQHRTARAQRDVDLDRRDARATITPHGTGEIIVSGAAERITAAMGRVDDLARAVRARGDGRTLAQLRSDIMLDLVLFGDIPALTHPTPTHARPDDEDRAAEGDSRDVPSETGRDLGVPGDANGASGVSAAPIPAMVPGSGVPQWVAYLPGGLPPATIWVVIPASALLDLSDEPGRMADGTPLPAHVVRDLAFTAGTTWRRLVTDPLTGEAIELSTTSYTPPPRLREAIQARDGTIVWTTGTGRQYTTYPMQYDETAPGRPTTAPTAPTDTTPDTTTPDRRRLLPDLSEESPIDHRPHGGTPTTRHAKHPPGRRGAPPPHATPDPGPPPF